jgi:hypothetical protein
MSDQSFQSCFLLQHVHVFENEEEDVKLLGVYRTRSDAEAALYRLKNKPGFRDALSGFSIDEYEFGKDHWTEGYASV